LGVLNVVILLQNKIATMKDSYINNPFAQLLDEVRNLQISVDKLDAKLSEKHQVKPEAGPELLTTDEVCKLLSVCRVTLWHWEKKGILRSVRMGNLKRFRRKEINDMVDKK
jgi:excisionase family DNA binding protein